MNILKESKKETLPISFLTAFISKGWDEVGILKADIEAISKEFAGTKKVESLIQDLIDAYLVCIGQMEAHLSAKDYLEYPEALTEDVKINIDNVNVNIDEIELDKTSDETEDESELMLKKANEEEKPSKEAPDSDASDISTEDTKNSKSDPFEYFCDFEEPDLSETKISDEELYN